MSLTAASGPFGTRPLGEFNFERPRMQGVIYWEPSPRRVRGDLAGEVVVDSRAAMLLHETGHLPVWYFPRADVRTDLLEPSAKRTRCPWKSAAATPKPEAVPSRSAPPIAAAIWLGVSIASRERLCTGPR